MDNRFRTVLFNYLLVIVRMQLSFFFSPDGGDVRRFVWNVLTYHGKSVLILMHVSEAFSR